MDGRHPFATCCATLSPKRADHRNRKFNARLMMLTLRSFQLFSNCTLFIMATSGGQHASLPQRVGSSAVHVLRAAAHRSTLQNARSLPCQRSLFVDHDAHLAARVDFTTCAREEVCFLRSNRAAFLLGSPNASVQRRLNATARLLKRERWNAPRQRLMLSGMRF